MLRSGFAVCLLIFTFFITADVSVSQDRIIANWRTPVEFQCGEMLETRAPNIFTFYEFESCIPSLVLTAAPGGTQFGLYNMAPYLNTEPPNLPPQSEVEDAFTPLDLGTNQIFSIDGPFKNENGQNVSVACTGGFPGNPDAIITEGCTNFQERIAIEDISCFEIDSAYAQGIHYASVYDGSNILVFQSDDGGFNWENYQTIPNTCGVVDGCAKHTTAAWWATPNPNSGICVFYNTTNGNNISYNVNCTQRQPNGSFTEITDEEFDEALAQLLGTIPEQRAITSMDGSTIINLYPKQVGGTRNWNAVSILRELNGGNFKTSNPLGLTNIPDNEVLTGGLAELPGVQDAIERIKSWAFAQNTPNDLVDEVRGQVLFNNFFETVDNGGGINVLDRTLGIPANYPFRSTNDIAPLDIGLIVDFSGGYRTPAIGDSSCLVSELFVQDSLAIPSLNKWGLIVLAGLIFIVGILVIRRKKPSTQS